MLCGVAPPVYLPMLASAGALDLRGGWAAEPKLDGWRAIVTVDPSLPAGFEVRSRTGRFITSQVPRTLSARGSRVSHGARRRARRGERPRRRRLLHARQTNAHSTRYAHRDAVRVRRVVARRHRL